MEIISIPMAKFSRGDVVIASVPQGRKFKLRPVVIVQNDRNNVRLSNVIAVMISSNTSLATKEATQVLIDVTIPAGKQSGLKQTSAVKCENLYTLPKNRLHRIGGLTPDLQDRVDAALKESLALK